MVSMMDAIKGKTGDKNSKTRKKTSGKRMSPSLRKRVPHTQRVSQSNYSKTFVVRNIIKVDGVDKVETHYFLIERCHLFNHGRYVAHISKNDGENFHADTLAEMKACLVRRVEFEAAKKA